MIRSGLLVTTHSIEEEIPSIFIDFTFFVSQTDPLKVMEEAVHTVQNNLMKRLFIPRVVSQQAKEQNDSDWWGCHGGQG
jgi:hypothetical protein